MAETRDVGQRRRDHLSRDAMDRRRMSLHVVSKPPAVRATPRGRRTLRPIPSSAPPPLLVVAEQRNPMHRRLRPAPVATERDREASAARHLHLRRAPDQITGKVDVLEGADDPAARLCRDRDPVGTFRAVYAEDLGGAEIAAAVTRQDLVSGGDVLDRTLSPIGASRSSSPQRGTAHRRRPPSGSRCSSANNCSQRYWAWLVSWYSSTSTWRKPLA